jgi:hypothetical protein
MIDNDGLERYMALREAVAVLNRDHENLKTSQIGLKQDMDSRFDKMDKKVDERFDKLDTKLEEILAITSELKGDKQAVKGGWKAVSILAAVVVAIYTAILQFVEQFSK